MDQKLSDLVDKVVTESAAYASFDDYLQSKEKGSECEKPAVDAVDNSSNGASAKADAPAESSQPTSAAPATEPTNAPVKVSKPLPVSVQKEELTKFPGIANGKPEPVHPIANPLPVEIPEPTKGLEDMPVVVNAVELTQVNWDGKILHHSEDVSYAVKPEDEPEAWKKIFLLTRDTGLKLTPEQIVDRIHELEEGIQKFKQAQRGYRSALEDKLKEANSEARAKAIGDLDSDYRKKRNAKAAERMKAERKPSSAPKTDSAAKISAANIKFADQMAQGMGLRGDKLCDFLQGVGKLDEATAKHIRDKWGAK